MDNFDLRKYLAEGKLLKEENLDIPLNDFGSEFVAKAKEIFGDDFKLTDSKVYYNPSNDTGGAPNLSFGFIIPQTQSKGKGVNIAIQQGKNFGDGYISYREISKEKGSMKDELENVFIPLFRKVATSILAKTVKSPELLTKATTGFGYEYEPKDQADLDKYVANIPKLPVKPMR